MHWLTIAWVTWGKMLLLYRNRHIIQNLKLRYRTAILIIKIIYEPLQKFNCILSENFLINGECIIECLIHITKISFPKYNHTFINGKFNYKFLKLYLWNIWIKIYWNSVGKVKRNFGIFYCSWWVHKYKK